MTRERNIPMEIQYSNDGKIAMVDGYGFCRDDKTGYYLSSYKFDGKRRKRLHVYMWEKHNGKIPKGYQIHHKDHDKSNNEITNLEILSKEEHQKYHAQHMSEETKAKLRKNLIEKAVPASKAWHASEEGHEWHSKHMKNILENRTEKEYECTWCGKKFETKHIYSKKSNHFCSNNCKSAFRRASGVDDIDIQCAICGDTFRANKYAKKTKCSKCSKRRNK